MKVLITFAAGAVALVAIITACGGGGEADEPSSGPVEVVVVTPSGSATPRVRRTPTPTPVPTASPIVACSSNPDPAPPSALQVEEPKPNAQVKVPIHVRGWGAEIGQDNRGLSLSVVDQKSNVLQVNNLPPLPRDFRVAPPGMAVGDFTRPFAADVVLPDVTAPTPYCLWIHLGTSDTGRATGVVQVPIVLLPRQ